MMRKEILNRVKCQKIIVIGRLPESTIKSKTFIQSSDLIKSNIKVNADANLKHI